MSETPIYKNPNKPVEERVKDLMSRMTLDEKLGQLNQVHMQPEDREKVEQWIREGKVGSRILAGDAFGGSSEDDASDVKTCNELQRIAVEESRLGIPIINGRDIIHGHRTVFPIPLGQAASWNDELVEKAAEYSAKEASSYGVHWTFAPMLDISRDPRWGRIMEGAGEDTYLCSRMAEAQVKGYQGSDMSEEGRLAACAKHFVGYGAAEGGRDYNTTEISDNTLRNTYIPPFKAAVDAGCATVMSGFHEIGGEPVSGSKYLLTDILKDELNFKGYVISDWGSVYQLEKHGISQDGKGSAEIAFNAGVDMNMADYLYMKHLPELIEEGKVDLSRIDDAVGRILTVKFNLGLFERPYVDETRAAREILHQDHLDCSRRLAAESMVLLKNDKDLLPLKENIKIAVIGPLADAKRNLLGNWTLDGKAEETVSLIEGMEEVAANAEILISSHLFDEQLKTARKADIVVLALGECFHSSGESQNVTEIRLPKGQEDLVEAISGLGKPVVSVVFAGRSLALTKVETYSDAILYAWHPGTQGGLAVADILFGKENPSGRLPVTMPRATGQVPLYYNHKPNPHSIDEYYGQDERAHYVDQLGCPLYPFGFGLSYTKFEYSKIKIVSSASQSVEVSVELTNTGQIDGYEVVQLYIRDKVASVTRPVRELKGYEKVFLKMGETKTVSFKLGFEELSFYGKDGKRILEPGEYRIWIGPDCLTENFVDWKCD